MIVFGIVAAAFLGAAVRALITDLDGSFNRHFVGTLIVNVLGAFALGVLVGADVSSATLHAVGVGTLGALTTFSTAISQIECIARERTTGYAVAVGAGSLGLILVAAWLGLRL